MHQTFAARDLYCGIQALLPNLNGMLKIAPSSNLTPGRHTKILSPLVQHCVWKLGASTVSLFFGLRLVFTVALTEPILGATIIKTGVQVSW